MTEHRRYQYEPLRRMTEEVFRRFGYTDEESWIIADVLLTSDLMGIESHGVQRLVLYPYGISIGRIKLKAPLTVVKETPLSVVLDAGAGMGQIAGYRAMKMAIEKAKKTGYGMALVRNSNHYGIAGYYSMMAAKEGLLGMSMTNTQALVVPTFGRQPLLGTNPIAVTMPASPTFFHLDMSTSVVTAGKMEVYAKNKEPLPAGWAVDEMGSVNTSAQVFVKNRGTGLGGLLPLGGAGEKMSGHKGYGLSVLVELMTGVLSGGVTSNFVRAKNDVEACCHVFTAMDYGMLTDDKSALEAHFSEYLETLRSSQTQDGEARIYTHGEKETEHMARALREGVPIGEATLAEIKRVCQERGINGDEYLIEA